MALTIESRTQISEYLTREINRYLREGLHRDAQNFDRKPFHARLLPQLFGGHLSERSFSTRSGSWWQVIARIVASQYHRSASNGHHLSGRIRNPAIAQVQEIISQLNDPTVDRRPDRMRDIDDVLRGQAPGGEETTVISDLFVIRHDDTEMYFEIKTPQPNKDTSMAMKRFILKVSAMRKGHPCEAFAATAYNPYGDGNAYTWNYARQSYKSTRICL